MATLKEHEYIFICGLHRSGTWLQTHSLDLHPEISLLGTTNNTGDGIDYRKHEGQFLQTVYPDDDYYGGVGRLGFHPEIHLTETSPLVTEDNRRKIHDEWNRYWDLDKHFLLEKTPANLMRSRFLQAMFPQSKFIMVMRHPVAVSLAQQKWTGTSLYSLIEHWLICYETLADDLTHLNEYTYLRYEDFIESPASHMDETFNFLCIEPIDETKDVRKDGNERYFAPWQNALENKIDRRSLGHRIIKRIMPIAIERGYPILILEDEIELIINRFENRVNRFGYSLSDIRDLSPLSFETQKLSI